MESRLFGEERAQWRGLVDRALGDRSLSGNHKPDAGNRCRSFVIIQCRYSGKYQVHSAVSSRLYCGFCDRAWRGFLVPDEQADVAVFSLHDALIVSE